MNMTEITFIEVFAGCGGLSTGIIDAGLTPLLLVDNDKNCIATLKHNHDENIILMKDVTQLHLEEYKGKCHVLIGGVPCQAWSQAGKRKGFEDPRGTLFFDFARLIEECNPIMFVVENVQGLMTINKGQTIQQITQMLNVDDKYNVQFKLFNAVDYEVPQKRKRILIVGTLKTHGEYTFPEPVADKKVLRDVLLNCPESIGMTYPEHKRAIMELVPQGGCWVNLPEQVQREYMGNSFESGGGKRGIARRLSMEEACLTLTTSPCQKQTERCHPIETRPLNVREYARIQTFPDSYTFLGGTSSQYKQIGNAVPVMFAFHVGKSIKKYFENIHI